MIGNLKTKLTLLTIAFALTFAFGQNKKFKVVLDAGHGGKDYGAIHNGFVEKKIVLDVVLKVGEILEKDPQIEVVYTRKTDVFVELRERANIANRADANLFVSIHCNGHKSSTPLGTETFVMGLSRAATNLEVAKKENSVITLESDYKVKYKGFDPNMPETMIGLTLMQEEFLNQSIILAMKIQDGFENTLKRTNRGVKQAPLWVLDATVMPGVLIELGFLSNKTEGEYVNSESGKAGLAKSVADAIISYKKEYFAGEITDGKNDQLPVKAEKPKENSTQTTTPIPAPQETVKPVATEQPSKGIVFKVQIAASGKNLDLVPSNFNGLNNISKDVDTSLVKYYYGETSDYEKVKQLVQEAKANGYPSAFVVAFKNGKRIDLKEALK